MGNKRERKRRKQDKIFQKKIKEIENVGFCYGWDLRLISFTDVELKLPGSSELQG